jgi:hypothetical protein
MPSLSVEQVDKKIREHEEQLTELRIVRAAIVKFGGNGIPATPTKKTIRRFPREATTPNSTGLKAAILQLDLPSPFTVETVVDTLKAARFDFAGREPKAAIRDCLYVLAKKKKDIRLARQGKGGEQSQYEKIL